MASALFRVVRVILKRMDLVRIREALQRQKIDGWLFFDHHRRDPLAYRVLGLDPPKHVTRRWYYLVPAHGTPRKLVHKIESDILNALPGDFASYSSWQEQEYQLRRLLIGINRVAMQYSPECAIPYVSMVDAGTIELVQRLGPEVATSAELIQEFGACLSTAQFETHHEAGRRVDKVRSAAFEMIRQQVSTGVDELIVRDFVLEQFKAAGLVTDSGPIVAVNQNAGNPHYEPLPETNLPIRSGDLVLLDMWARLDQPDAVFYDITWTGFCGNAPDEVHRMFDLVRSARDIGVREVQRGVKDATGLRGFEVDDAVRNHIAKAGYGEYFLHRTGHSIGSDVHGTGANLDNFETHDERKILPGALFSIEPGVYFDRFGIRLELDVFVGDAGAEPTGEVQMELVQL